MSVMQINITDSEISGTSSKLPSNAYHSNSSVDLDSLMNNLTTSSKKSHSLSKTSTHDGNALAGANKKDDLIGKKK